MMWFPNLGRKEMIEKDQDNRQSSASHIFFFFIPPLSSPLIMITMIAMMMIIIMLTCDSGHPLVIISSGVLRQAGRSDVGVGGPVELQHDNGGNCIMMTMIAIMIIEQKRTLDLRLDADDDVNSCTFMRITHLPILDEYDKKL